MFGDKASRKRTGEGPGCHPFSSLRASSERSEGSLRASSQTLRGVYPERSEGAKGDRHSLQISEIVDQTLTCITSYAIVPISSNENGYDGDTLGTSPALRERHACWKCRRRSSQKTPPSQPVNHLVVAGFGTRPLQCNGLLSTSRTG